MTAANALTQWARVLFASLADAGVTDVVTSPGSRSTPFIVAAAAEPRLRCHSVMDERAAAFFALGQARMTGRPSALLCTSGTAAAHYFPAVVEAGLAHLPLVVVTADRPLELQDCGAPQTIDQVKLYGDHVRRFYELGGPDTSPAALAGLRRLAQQAVHFTRWPVPGAVHLNVRARKPLEPVAAADEEQADLERLVDHLLGRPPTRARPPLAAPDPAAVAEVADLCASTERGLVVAGPAPLSAARHRSSVFDLVCALGYPLLAEAPSQLRLTAVPAGVHSCDAFDVVLRAPAFADAHRPDVVIEVGTGPTSGAWESFRSRNPDCFRVVVAPHGWPDPQGDADLLLLGDPEPALAALAHEVVARPRRGRGAWVEEFRKADERAWEAVDALLGDEGSHLREGHVMREVVRHLPPGSTLMVGNSLPVRAVDTYVPSGVASVGVLSQRGANGIEGLLAGAAGSATAASGPLTLVLGDVSLVHDLTSLALAAAVGVPVVVVVPNNGGGRIFEQLPVARVPDLPRGALEHITTPHRLSFEGAAATFGARYRRVDSVPSLRAALAGAYDRPGAVLVEAVVPPHGAAEDLGALCTAVGEALA